MKYLLTIIPALTLLSCSSSNTLESYGKKLIECSEAGTFGERYLDSFETNDPLSLLKLSYLDIQNKWIYINDEQGTDRPQLAEDIFEAHVFRGDCEDQAVVLMAILRQLNISARFCLAQQKDTHSGHVWTEVLIQNTKGLSQSDLSRIIAQFPENKIITEGEYLWLALIHQIDYQKYTPEYYIYSNMNHEL